MNVGLTQLNNFVAIVYYIMQHKTTKATQASNHLQQLKECINSLSEKAFWQYVKLYGIVASNFDNDRVQASTILMKIYEKNEKRAEQAIRHLGYIPCKKVG